MTPKIPQKSTPIPMRIRMTRPGQTVRERIEEILGRTVGDDERMSDLQDEILMKAPEQIVSPLAGPIPEA